MPRAHDNPSQRRPGPTTTRTDDNRRGSGGAAPPRLKEGKLFVHLRGSLLESHGQRTTDNGQQQDGLD